MVNKSIKNLILNILFTINYLLYYIKAAKTVMTFPHLTIIIEII